MEANVSTLRSPRRKVIVVTHPNGFFGRAEYGWKSLDVDILVAGLSDFANVMVVPIDELMDCEVSASDIVLYCSSDEPNIRQYYKDVLFFLDDRATLVPAIEFLMAHENKGFQELHKKRLGIGGLDGSYFFDLDGIDCSTPYVLKSADGAGSSGVWLIRRDKDLRRIRRKLFRVSPIRKLIRMYRKLRLGRSDFEMYAYRHKGFDLAVHQEFVPGLTGDYKVLVFGDRFYVLRRAVRKGDFRASGSGHFQFDTRAEVEVLDYARSVHQALFVPYISLDIVRTESGECALIEYQALHFGPYTLLKSPGYFHRPAGYGWQFVPQTSCIEAEMVRALDAHIQRLEHAQAPG